MEPALISVPTAIPMVALLGPQDSYLRQIEGAFPLIQVTVRGNEFFVKGDQVWFSEVSPRPHDTGMVTMASQRFNEFELHARAILGLPVNVEMRSPGASAVIYGGVDSKDLSFDNVEQALAVPDTDIRLFGKPESFERRRMGVALSTGKDVDEARARAKQAANLVKPIAND